jgi:predicted dehydrogenase
MLDDPFSRYTLLEPAIANFVHDVLNSRPPKASAEDGRQNVEICLAVLESARTHHPVDIRQPVRA